MRKEELRKLRALPATKEMMQKGKEYTEKDTFWMGRKRHIIEPLYEILMRVQSLKQYIKIAVFLPEDMRKDIKTPRYEIFLNVEGEEYITRQLDQNGKEVKWLTSMVKNLNGISYYKWYYLKDEIKCYITQDGRKTINDLHLEKDLWNLKGIRRLQAWQQEQKDKETKRREQKEQAPWDQEMKLVPKLPKGFGEWMRKEACRDFYIIYEYDRNGAKKGYCSRCKKMVPIRNPRHDKKTKCPSCKAEAVFKASGRIKTLSTDSYEAEIMQKIQGGIVIRQFSQRQGYRCKDYKEPNVYSNETERILIYEDGKIKRYFWGLYKNKYQRWILDAFSTVDYRAVKRTYYWNRRIKIYKRNLASLKKNTFIRYSAMDLWPELPTSIQNYIEIEKSMPIIEKLARIGMFRLAEDIINENHDDVDSLINKEETEIARMLFIDKARLKRLKAMDAGAQSLEWMQMEKYRNTIWPDEMIREFGENGIACTDFSFLQEKSYTRIYSYMKKQSRIMKEDLAQVLSTWRDYINMATKMKMNIEVEQIAKPKDLKRQHDALVRMEEQKGIKKIANELEKKWPKVNGQLPKLKKFEYQDGQYCIIAPEDMEDIVEEGVILRHCIHTCDYYLSRIQRDETYIFFLRKKCDPEMPWYTLEVEPSGNIRQKRTTGDNQNKDFREAVPFLTKWQQYFKKQLTEEEVELGKKSDKLRKEEYRKLRKDENRVWHGPLAGQLLADVLEADFMRAM